ncbi:MAG: leucyl aminopeptidase family protein [Oligoflexus sp.]
MNTLPGRWTDHLPTSYRWMDQVKVEGQRGLSAQGWNVVPVAKNDKNWEFLATGLDAGLQQKLQTAIGNYGWSAQEKPLRLILDEGSFLLVNKPAINTSASQLARHIGFEVAASLVKCDKKAIALLPMKEIEPLDLLEGFCLGIEEAGYFKTDAAVSLSDVLQLPQEALKAWPARQAMIKSLIFTKWLQDAPANVLHSETFAAIAEEHFKGKAKVVVLGRDEMRKLGMGAILSVGEGAVRDPKLITLFFEGEKTDKTVALIGKGVTFDTGGINLKPSAGLEEMKYDMSGAAAVFGAAHYFAEVKPAVNVVCAIGAVENMPSATATLPGDVVKSLSGKTIEILNTDAEGRLVLADVLTHTIRNFKPHLTLDVATLTGAVIFGLGHAGAAIMTAKDETADYLSQVGKSYGEPLWRLPLWPELEAEVASELSDLKNIAKPNVKAGTIMGGWFLHEFAKESDGQWAHIDIAGTAWNCCATGYHKTGGSAYGVRLLVGACERFEA